MQPRFKQVLNITKFKEGYNSRFYEEPGYKIFDGFEMVKCRTVSPYRHRCRSPDNNYIRRIVTDGACMVLPCFSARVTLFTLPSPNEPGLIDI